MVCVCVCMRACVRACVRAYVRACVHACVFVRVYVCVCLFFLVGLGWMGVFLMSLDLISVCSLSCKGL